MKRFLTFAVVMLALVGVGVAAWPGIYPEALAGDQLEWSGYGLYRQVAVENVPWSMPNPPTPWIPCKVKATEAALSLIFHRGGEEITAAWDADCQCYLLVGLEGDSGDFYSFTVDLEAESFLITSRLGTFTWTGSMRPWWDFDDSRLSIVSEIIESPHMRRSFGRRR